MIWRPVLATILLLASMGAHGQSKELRTLATHEEPTKGQVALLTVDPAKLDEEAAKANIEVVRDGDDVLLFDADLYNVRQMSVCLHGFDVLTGLLRDGRRTFVLGDLPESDRKAVREILLAQGVADSAGPAVFDDKSPISLGVRWKVDATLDGRTVSFGGGQPSGERDAGKLRKYGKDEVDKFIRDDLPKRRVKWHQIDSLSIRHSDGWTLVSTRRTAAVSKLMKLMEQRIGQQAKEYAEKQKAMKAAFGSKGAPTEGQPGRGLPESLKADMTRNWKALGFASQDAASRFLDSATVRSPEPTVMIMVQWMGDNVGHGSIVQATVNRGSGR